MASGDIVPGLGGRIKARREALGLTQRALADKLGAKSAVQVSLYEGEHRAPSAASLIALSRALKCGVDYLLGLTDKP